MRTAVSVPIWVIAVNAAPGSAPPGRSSPTMRRCALEEIGRNSVSPWTRPRTTASHHVMAGRLYRPGQVTPPRPGPVACTAMEERLLGRTGLRVSALGLGTLTWSRDTD